MTGVMRVRLPSSAFAMKKELEAARLTGQVRRILGRAWKVVWVEPYIDPTKGFRLEFLGRFGPAGLPLFPDGDLLLAYAKENKDRLNLWRPGD